MLIFFIWIGTVLPQHYYSTISECEKRSDYKCVLLEQAHFDLYYEKYRDLLQIYPRQKTLANVEKSDLLRYMYLYEHGGVYSDLDNVIDYDCLNQFLSNSSLPQSFFGEEQKELQLQKPSNNFIFARHAKDPEILRIMNCIKNCLTCQTLDFTSPYMLYREKARFVRVKKCINHLYDSTWWFDAGIGKRPDWQKQQTEKHKESNQDDNED